MCSTFVGLRWCLVCGCFVGIALCLRWSVVAGCLGTFVADQLVQLGLSTFAADRFGCLVFVVLCWYPVCGRFVGVVLGLRCLVATGCLCTLVVDQLVQLGLSTFAADQFGCLIFVARCWYRVCGCFVGVALGWRR